jgi:hypothetical protein
MAKKFDFDIGLIDSHTKTYTGEVRGCAVQYHQRGGSYPESKADFVHFEAQRVSDGWRLETISFAKEPKLHISMKNYHPEALTALAELAAEHGIHRFKVSPFLEDFFNKNAKTMTVYHSEVGIDGKPIDWKGFMERAQAIVNRFGGPGHKEAEQDLMFERRVPEASATTYRFDRNPNIDSFDKSYFEIKDLPITIPVNERYNPYGLPDPLLNIALGKQVQGTTPAPNTQKDPEIIKRIAGTMAEAFDRMRLNLSPNARNGVGDVLENIHGALKTASKSGVLNDSVACEACFLLKRSFDQDASRIENALRMQGISFDAASSIRNDVVETAKTSIPKLGLSWAHARTVGGEPIARIPIDTLSPEQVRFIKSTLDQKQIPFDEKHSKALQQNSIRVTGHEAVAKLVGKSLIPSAESEFSKRIALEYLERATLEGGIHGKFTAQLSASDSQIIKREPPGPR